MNFYVSRNGQVYGPYTLADLQRYVQTGNVLLTDLAKSEDMSEWLPVSQVLASSGSAAAVGASPAYTDPAGTPAPPAYASSEPVNGTVDPPNLSWVLVLVLDVLTCSFFQMVWNIVLSAWFRRVYPASKALPLYIASAVLLVVQWIDGRASGLMSGSYGMYGMGNHSHLVFGRGLGMYGLISLATWITRLVTRFTFRAELEQHFNAVDPIGLRLGPILTFFFGGIYFQYHLNRINDIKRAMRYRGQVG